jgi:hypothetical protein
MMETNLVEWIRRPEEPGNKVTELPVSFLEKTLMVVDKDQIYPFGA